MSIVVQQWLAQRLDNKENKPSRYLASFHYRPSDTHLLGSFPPSWFVLPIEIISAIVMPAKR